MNREESYNHRDKNVNSKWNHREGKELEIVWQKRKKPPLNPEKETPGFFFEILTLREFRRNPSILPFHSAYSIPMARKSAGSNNKVLARSHSGIRGWFQPWSFTGAFTRCNYPACSRIHRKSSLDSIRVHIKGRGGGGGE